MKRFKGLGDRSITVFLARNNEGKPIRVATYVHDDRDKTPVFLFDFIAHKGSDGGIEDGVKERAVRLAHEARALLNEEEKQKTWL